MSAKHKQVDANAITPEQWVAILNEDFKTHREFMGPSYENAVVDAIALDYVATELFNYYTYDGDMDVVLVKQTLAVCQALVDGTTYEYLQRGDADRLVYTYTMHMPFLYNRTEWGTSIRGAWLSDCEYQFSNASFNGLLLDTVKFTRDGFTSFVKGILLFAKQYNFE